MMEQRSGTVPTAIGPVPRDEQQSSLSNIADFYRLLNFRRQVAAGTVPEPRGFFYGDGVARDFSGKPFEPLSWDTRLLPKGAR